MVCGTECAYISSAVHRTVLPKPQRKRKQVTQVYNVSGVPRYYLVDPQGLIVEDRLRVFDVDEVVAKIEENL